MTGDGTNDAPALAQADVGVAMNTGTTAAKEAGNMVDLDSNPTKLIEIVEIGKQLLMTRGALTTFSIANDVAKYFAIIPAMFILAFPQLGVLNVMRLATPESAILSAVIFNAVIIIALIPLALKGIAYQPLGAAAILRRNLLIYGLGGVVLPFVGIKAIDLLLVAVGSPEVCHDHRARPTADALLARIQQQERARLRVYIGAAPGVGKTYEMLQEAHALRARGSMSSSAWSRPTAAGTPRRRSRTWRSCRARRRLPGRDDRRDGRRRHHRPEPQVCVVDELAHTNAPGSRNAKRYEDVLDCSTPAST